MADTFETLQNNIKSDAVVTAQKAVDYLENDMLCHMENLLDDHLTKWRQRHFQPIYENPTKILIERSAKTYKESPRRAVTLNGDVSEALTEKYNDLLRGTNLNFISQDLDARARLFRASLLLPQFDVDSGNLTLTVLSRNNSDVVFNRLTGEMEGLIYTTGLVGLNGGVVSHLWTPTEIRDFEGGKLVGSVMTNPYGIIPAAILNDTRPPLGVLWKYKTWEQLIQFSDGVNLFNTEALFNARYSMVGSPVTNMDIPDGFVMGIDTPLSTTTNDGSDPFFEFRAPTSTIDQFLNWFNKFKEAIADEWGVNLKFAGGSIADSGFKLVVEEFENIELRQKRVVAAKQFEEDLYQVFAAMSVVHDWGLDVNGRGVADFVEPKLPVNEQNEWLIAKEQIATGVLTMEEYWIKRDPDLTPEQLAEKRRLFDQFRGLAATVPSFEA